MAKFNYVAVDLKGQERSGVLEARDNRAVEEQLKNMGYYPTSVTAISDEAPAKGGGKAAPAKGGKKGAAKKGGALSLEIKLPGLGGGVKSKQLTIFTRQLATLIDAGLPLLRGLNVLNKQEKNPTLKRITAELAEAVEAGSTFSEGLAQHQKVFDRLYVNMVRAGEIGGVLEVVLNRLAEFQEKAQKIKGKDKAKVGPLEFAKAFPDLKVTVNNAWGFGDVAIVEYTMAGTQKGAFMGKPASKKAMNVHGVDVFQVKDGKVAHLWTYENGMEMAMQLGWMKMPAAPAAKADAKADKADKGAALAKGDKPAVAAKGDKAAAPAKGDA